MTDTDNNGGQKRSRSKENKDADEEFEMEHSDEEMRFKDGKEWEPAPEEIVELLEKIEKDKLLDLEWTTPGRRPPTPALKLQAINEVNKLLVRKREKKPDFEFQEEMPNLKMFKAIRPAGSDSGPKGGAKKKTISLDAILLNMARHRKLDMLDDDEDLLP